MVWFVYLRALHDVRRHFASIKPKRDVLCELMVIRLISSSPAFREYAAGREAAVATEMARVLRIVVNNSRNLEEWWELLEELGARLGAMGLAVGASNSISRVLEGALIDGVSATEPEVEAWRIFVGAAWGGMLPGIVHAQKKRLAA